MGPFPVDSLVFTCKLFLLDRSLFSLQEPLTCFSSSEDLAGGLCSVSSLRLPLDPAQNKHKKKIQGWMLFQKDERIPEEGGIFLFFVGPISDGLTGRKCTDLFMLPPARGCSFIELFMCPPLEVPGTSKPACRTII